MRGIEFGSKPRFQFAGFLMASTTMLEGFNRVFALPLAGSTICVAESAVFACQIETLGAKSAFSGKGHGVFRFWAHIAHESMYSMVGSAVLGVPAGRQSEMSRPQALHQNCRQERRMRVFTVASYQTCPTLQAW